MRAIRIISTILSVALVLDLMAYTLAHSAEMSTCHVYANRTSAEALKRLLGMTFVDISVGRFMYRKAYSTCLNADEPPEMTFSAEEQPIVDGMPTPPTRPEPPPGSVPATDAADAPAEVPVAPVAPKAKAGKGDQPLCTRNGKRTVYTGKHWRCRK